MKDDLPEVVRASIRLGVRDEFGICVNTLRSPDLSFWLCQRDATTDGVLKWRVVERIADAKTRDGVVVDMPKCWSQAGQHHVPLLMYPVGNPTHYLVEGMPANA